MKRFACLVVFFYALCATAHTVTNTLVVGDFSSSNSFPADVTQFVTQGDASYSSWGKSMGGICLNTDKANYAKLYSLTGYVATADHILSCRFRCATYHDSSVWGDFQPRGLRVGTDGNNAIEFYSASASTIGMRIVKGGTAVWTGTPCNVGEYWQTSGASEFSWRDYEIDVTTTSATFRVDGVIKGVYTGANIPTGRLNLHVSTYYSGGGKGTGYGQVPIVVRVAELYRVGNVAEWEIQDNIRYALNPQAQSATIIGLDNLPASSDVVIPAEIAVQGIRYRVNALQSDAFVNQTNMRTLTLSTNISTVSWNLFTGCTGLIGFNVAEGHATYAVTNGALCSKDYQRLLLYPNGRSGSYVIPDCISCVAGSAFRASRIADVTLPSSVQTVESYAFYTCAQLTSVHFNSGLHTIGDWAFSMSGVTELIIPEGVTSVGYGAFRFNYAMKYIELPSSLETYPNEMASSCGLERILMKPGVKKTGYSIFWGNSHLKEVILPEGLEELGIYAFDWCSSMTNIVLPTTFNKAYGNTFANGPSLRRVVIPEGMPRLSGNSMFYLAVNLSEVHVASTVTQMEHSTFACCSSLSNITFGAQSQLMDIGRSGFHGCTSLTSFAFPTNLQSLGVYAFVDCRRLASPYLPASLTRVCDGAFENCTSFLGVYFDGNKPATWGTGVFKGIASTVNVYVWDTSSGFESTLEGHPVVRLFGEMADGAVSITGSMSEQIPSMMYLPSLRNGYPVTRIAEQAFANAHQLRWVTIPASIVSIASDAFSGCTNLIAFVVYSGNPVYKSEDGVVYSKDGTTLLLCPPGKTAMTIPASVTTLAAGAFTGCTRLNAIYFQGNPPTNMEANLFADLPADFSLYCLDEQYAGGALLGKDIRSVVLKIGAEKVSIQSYRTLLNDKVTQNDLDVVATNLASAGYASTSSVSGYLSQADLMGVDIKLLAQSNNVERFKTEIQLDGFAVAQSAVFDSNATGTTMQAASPRTARALSSALASAQSIRGMADLPDEPSSLSYNPLRIALSFKVKNGITTDEEALLRFRQALNTRVRAVVMNQLGGVEMEIEPASISYEGDLATVIFSVANDGSTSRFMKIKVFSASE